MRPTSAGAFPFINCLFVDFWQILFDKINQQVTKIIKIIFLIANLIKLFDGFFFWCEPNRICIGTRTERSAATSLSTDLLARPAANGTHDRDLSAAREAESMCIYSRMNAKSNKRIECIRRTEINHGKCAIVRAAAAAAPEITCDKTCVFSRTEPQFHLIAV